jgi:hypothetical protein
MQGHKTGGRQAGTPNKASAPLRPLLEERAGAPIPVLLLELALEARERGDIALAVLALSKAAPYAYARVKDPDLVQAAPAIVVVDGVPQLHLESYPGPVVYVNTPLSEKDVVFVGQRAIIDDIQPLPPLTR